jgi:hypothetical protein
MTAHDIPDTAEIRTRMAESQQQGLTALGLKPTGVEIWEDGYRAADAEDSTFEWWYFDCQFDDGSTLVVTFSNKPHTDPSGPLTPTVLIIRQLADGTRLHLEPTFPASEFHAATDRCDVRIGPNTVTGDLDHYVLHVEGDGIVADVTIDREAPSWRPGAGINYFDSARTHYLAWVVRVPYGRVSATITESGATSQVSGSAYHDHNWGNHLMGSFLDHWYWGRAHVADYTVVYVRMTTKGLLSGEGRHARHRRPAAAAAGDQRGRSGSGAPDLPHADGVVVVVGARNDHHDGDRPEAHRVARHECRSARPVPRPARRRAPDVLRLQCGLRTRHRPGRPDRPGHRPHPLREDDVPLTETQAWSLGHQ